MSRNRTSKEVDSASHPMEDIIQVRLARLVEITSQLGRRHLGPKGLRRTDLRIMNILYDEKTMSINELARRTHVDKAWISRSVVQLLERKWIDKQQDPEDSRAQRVKLTAKGRRLLDQLRPTVLREETFLLQGINEKAFKKNLDTLMRNAEKLLDRTSAR